MPKHIDYERVICRFIRGVPGALYDMGVGPKSEWRKLAVVYPRMQVCGCEPHPAQYEALRQAKFPGSLLPVAIGEKEGTATLHIPTDDLKCCSLLPLPFADSTCEVEVWTLDKFDRHMGCPERVLLWLDIEGNELPALRSGPQLLSSSRVRWINLEERRNGDCPAPGWTVPRELHAFLSAHGYVRVADYNRHPTHQDAIYVHREEPCSASSR